MKNSVRYKAVARKACEKNTQRGTRREGSLGAEYSEGWKTKGQGRRSQQSVLGSIRLQPRDRHRKPFPPHPAFSQPSVPGSHLRDIISHRPVSIRISFLPFPLSHLSPLPFHPRKLKSKSLQEPCGKKRWGFSCHL